MDFKDIIENISNVNKDSVKNMCDQALMDVFRIKNLLLFSYKLLMKYESLMTSVCSQLKINPYIVQMQYIKTVMASTKNEIERKQHKVEIIQKNIDQFKNKLIHNNLFMPGKENPLLYSCEYLASEYFTNCDDKCIDNRQKPFYSKVDDYMIVKQKCPVVFYKEFLYLQMHFILLLVQGSHYALPILMNSLGFLDRMLFWPKSPHYGICNKSKLLDYNLGKIKAAVIQLLLELINSLNETEKSLLFHDDNKIMYKQIYEDMVKEHHNLLKQLSKYNNYITNLKLEHSRLVGLLVKQQPDIMQYHPELITLVTFVSPTASIESLKIVNDTYNNIKSILSDNRTTNQLALDQSSISMEHFENCPININLNRAQSLPNEHLICHCLSDIPSINETLEFIYKKPKNTNKNNKKFFIQSSSLNSKTFLKSSDSSFKDRKSIQKYKTINNSMISNNNMVARLSGNSDIKQGNSSNKLIDNVTTEFSLTLKLLQSNDNRNIHKIGDENIVNEYLRNFNLQLQPNLNSEIMNINTNNLPITIYKLTDDETQTLWNISKSENCKHIYHTATEQNLYDSIQIFSKYSQI